MKYIKTILEYILFRIFCIFDRLGYEESFGRGIIWISFSFSLAFVDFNHYILNRNMSTYDWYIYIGISLIGLIISFFVRIDYYRKLKKKFASGYYNDDYWHIKGFIIYALLIVPVILFLFINNQ